MPPAPSGERSSYGPTRVPEASVTSAPPSAEKRAEFVSSEARASGEDDHGADGPAVYRAGVPDDVSLTGGTPTTRFDPRIPRGRPRRRWGDQAAGAGPDANR